MPEDEALSAPGPWMKCYDSNVPHSTSYPAATLHALFEESAARYPDRCAIIFMGEKLSYRRLAGLIDRFAAALQQLGTGRGEKVLLFLPNCPQFIIAYYGALKAGAVVVPANPLYTPRELLHLLEDSGARTVITLDLKMLSEKVVSVAQRVALKHIIVTGLQEFLPFPRNILFPLVKRKAIAGFKGDNVTRMRDLLARPSSPLAGPEVRHDDVAVILYTGGTTGVPKGACLTHDNLAANLSQCLHWIPDIRPGGETFLTALPVFHAFSMTTSMNLPLCAGATVILMPRFETAGLLRAIDRQRPSLFMGIPAMFHAIIHQPHLHRYDLSSLRFCVSGGDSLPPGVQQEFEHLAGCKLVEGYGLTEASPVVTCNPVYGARKGIGLPLPDTICRVVDLESGAPLAPGQDGEMIIRGPQVMREYYGNPGETAIAIRDGWLYSGDIVRMDEDGYFEFIGRKKDLIKVSTSDYMTAYKVYPSEVEEVLLGHEKVMEAAVIGVPDPLQGERVVAYVVAQPGAAVAGEELIDFCRQDLAEYKVPSEIEFVNELPRNMLGKVLRKELRAMSETKCARTEAPPNPGPGTA
ncbi:MAG: long-chain fatty acid--CoA ligase [Chloroflexi bacterium]|nr:long-chain fatty acid--CoA ligase [Chloroflexota bacterium]